MRMTQFQLTMVLIPFIISKMNRDERLLLKCHEVADILGVARKTVHRYVERGILPPPTKDPKNGYGFWKPSDIDVARRMLTANAHEERY